MATVIDISSKIRNEEKFVKFGDKTYKVDDRKNTVLEAQAILASATDGNDIAAIEAAMTKLIGAEATKDFDGLSLQDYLVPFYAVMACVNGKSYEETEAMFRNAGQNG